MGRLVLAAIVVAIVVVVTIFVVRGVEHREQMDQAAQQQAAYCQQYRANLAAQQADAAAGRVSTHGSMLNLYNC